MTDKPFDHEEYSRERLRQTTYGCICHQEAEQRPECGGTPACYAQTTPGDFRQYRRSQIAEMADWHDGFDMSGVSISTPDMAAGSPKAGDKIARNPANHADKWLVAAAYFAANFEALT